jgi:hypothetical protein
VRLAGPSAPRARRVAGAPPPLRRRARAAPCALPRAPPPSAPAHLPNPLRPAPRPIPNPPHPSQVDPVRNLLYVRGQVPGPAGGFVFVRDAFRWKWAGRAAARLPFPAAVQGGGAAAEATVAVAPRDGLDPYERYRGDVGEYAEGATWKTE